MESTIPATKAKNNFGELIRRVYTTGERVIVEKDGIPVVIIGPIYKADLLKQTQNKKDSALSKDAKGMEQSES